MRHIALIPTIAAVLLSVGQPTASFLAAKSVQAAQTCATVPLDLRQSLLDRLRENTAEIAPWGSPTQIDAQLDRSLDIALLNTDLEARKGAISGIISLATRPNLDRLSATDRAATQALLDRLSQAVSDWQDSATVPPGILLQQTVRARAQLAEGYRLLGANDAAAEQLQQATALLDNRLVFTYDRVNAAVEISRAYRQLGQPDEANAVLQIVRDPLTSQLAAFTASTWADPAIPRLILESAVNLGTEYIALGQPDRARELAQATPVNPTRSQLNLLLVKDAIARKQLNTARSILPTTIGAAGEQARVDLAVAYARNRQLSAAAPLFNEAIRSASQTGTPERPELDVPQLTRLIKTYAEGGQPDAAVQAVRQLRRLPGDKAAALMLDIARVYYQQNNVTKGDEAAELAAGYGLGSDSMDLAQANISQWVGPYVERGGREVFRFLQRTDMVDVNYFEWWQKLGNLALQANDIPLALEIAGAIANEGLKQELMRNTAMAYAKAKQPDKAMQTLDAIGLEGIYQVEAIAQVGKVLHQSGDTAAAKQAIDRALQLAGSMADEKERAQSLGSAASVLYAIGQPQSAKETLKQALQIADRLDDNPQQEVWAVVFRSLTREGQFDPAFDLLRRYPVAEKSIYASEVVSVGQALQREDVVFKFLPLANPIPLAKAQILSQVAQWQLAKGQTAAFEKTMKDAVSSARRISAPERDPMLAELTFLYARSGNSRQALRLVSRIQDEAKRDRIRQEVGCLND